jgi:rfaE bifunctional protein kinase chain/domain
MKILVCGDAMLDLYWFGDVHRISPEAPVPVVRMVRTEERAGAAANVARNCRSMGAEVTLISILGSDERGRQLEALLAHEDIRFLPCRSLVTTQKLRVIARSQQVARIDIDPEMISSALEELTAAYEREVGGCDIVLFSDYGKGALSGVSSLIALAKAAGKTVLVDPKGYDYERYRNADVVKPNLDEMRELVGGWKTEYELEQKARALRLDAGIGAVLLTRAADGMTLYTASGTTSITAAAREVYDVSGAGDAAIAALAVALGRGMTVERAAPYANKAAGIAVGRFGTTVVTESEVFHA